MVHSNNNHQNTPMIKVKLINADDDDEYWYQCKKSDRQARALCMDFAEAYFGLGNTPVEITLTLSTKPFKNCEVAEQSYQQAVDRSVTFWDHNYPLFKFLNRLIWISLRTKLASPQDTLTIYWKLK